MAFVSFRAEVKQIAQIGNRCASGRPIWPGVGPPRDSGRAAKSCCRRARMSRHSPNSRARVRCWQRAGEYGSNRPGRLWSMAARADGSVGFSVAEPDT